MILGVQDRVDDALALEHARKVLAHLYGNGTHQDGPALTVDGFDLVQHRCILLALGLID
ncbi:hypothetical protein SDC9_194397 [bioreactor metagenome]|uniref:Uncharacterized protein n=1 Tax=bioreactor metagenome TaxID=1076179 RepID=A0A645I6C5_9ZZZZ